MITNRAIRHLAIRVADVERSKQFYARVFGMKMVWQPDTDNAHLSSGCDNLALHREDNLSAGGSRLDHLGFIVPSSAEVESGYAWTQQNNIEIVRPLKHHRDGSVSFYIRDPDGIVIQILYEPSISLQEVR